MLYTVYRTVNLANGRYYFGVHKTEDPNDSHLGSGNYIRAVLAKYGEHGFRKDVLFIYLDPESAFAKEDELIQCYRGRDPLCMNLRKGGSGGFDWINRNGLSAVGGIRGLATRSRLIKTNPEYREKRAAKTNWREGQKHPKSITNDVAMRRKGQELGIKKWRGQKHTKATRELMSRLQQGNNNSQFGTRWITNGVIDSRIKKQALIPEGWYLGRMVR
jgi:hypothetical protein